MARAINKLSARSVATITKPGRHGDGGGLYLIVDPSGARRWLFMFRWQGKLKEMGLGGVSSVSLAAARQKAEEARRVLAEGRNPIEARREAEVAETAVVTFGKFADDLIENIKEGFRNEKHRQQWSNTLKTYAAALREKPVNEIGTENVLNVLQPIWMTKNETASRVRGRLERVLDAAKAKNLRSGENPARWRGHLDHLLPRRQKLQRGHHAAMPYGDVPGFIQTLRQREAVAAFALEFCVLCASRSGEVLGATWNEVDLASETWVIPASRMKAGREHRVPLSDRAIEILETMQKIKVSEFVFPGQRKDRPLSGTSMEMVLRRMKIENATMHGFRSSFRDWAGECTGFPREVAEQALAHSVGDETERAYRRGDALEKRRKLMEAWATYVGSQKTGKTSKGKVIPMKARRSA